ncbi:rna-directed dna polymerase from mobile element jockey-like [Pitangus sulphuratus]|nr:rna-directed dna polymerase from mobile element jockey-like [Pitangus sulphuratus]
MSGVPQELVLGLALFYIFVDGTDDGIECTLGKFANGAKLRGSVDTLERRHGIHKVLDRLERWACANLRMFNKAKCKVLLVGWGNPEHRYKLGREWIENNPEEKDLRVLFEEKLNVTWQCVLPAQNSNCILDIRKKFFTVRVVKHLNRFPRGVVDAISLEVFKPRLNGAVSNLV